MDGYGSGGGGGDAGGCSGLALDREYRASSTKLRVRHCGDPPQIIGRPGGWRYFIASRLPDGPTDRPPVAHLALSELSEVLVNPTMRVFSNTLDTNHYYILILF
ncbi:hypothetical protein M0802_006702 [Mischocyttarus mexicanus]|nr:hypothetical protein M0802_006702 [Mischocyttarus mexicanus]